MAIPVCHSWPSLTLRLRMPSTGSPTVITSMPTKRPTLLPPLVAGHRSVGGR